MSIMTDIERDLKIIERDVVAFVDLMTSPWAVTFLDWQEYRYVNLTNPIKVYYIRRTDGSIYATHTNRYLPGEIVIDSAVVHRFGNDDWSIQTSTVVADHLKKLQDGIKR